MKYLSLSILFPVVLALAAGCAKIADPSTDPIGKSNLTAGQVSLTLKKGITQQSEVVEVFGAPNLVTQNADGEEVWTYQRHATVGSSASNSAYATIILLGGSTGSSGFEQSSRTMTLIIKFKEVKGTKTVVDFSSRYSSHS